MTNAAPPWRRVSAGRRQKAVPRILRGEDLELVSREPGVIATDPIGWRTSPRRVLRVMRETDLLAHPRPGSARGPRVHNGTITTDRVDEMWRPDLAAVLTGEAQAVVFIAVDRCSDEW